MLSHEVAPLLGLSAVDVIYLEHGVRTMSGEDWVRAFEALRAARKEQGG